MIELLIDGAVPAEQAGGPQFNSHQGKDAGKAFLLELMPPTCNDSIAPQRGRSDICCICEKQSERGTWPQRPHRRFGYWLLKIIFDVSGAPAFKWQRSP